MTQVTDPPTGQQPTANSQQPVALVPAHAADAARLHILGQPGTFLTALGADVLTVLYRTLPQSPVGFGRAIVDEEGALLSFAAVTTSTGRLFVEMATSRLPQLLPPLLTRLLRQPLLIGRSVQTVVYPLLVGDSAQNHGKSAELLAIMTDPAQRSRGLGATLIVAIVDECRQRQIDHLDVTVDAGNAGARRFYEREGFIFQKPIRLYGRDMCVYRLVIRNQGSGTGDWNQRTGGAP